MKNLDEKLKRQTRRFDNLRRILLRLDIYVVCASENAKWILRGRISTTYMHTDNVNEIEPRFW